MCYQWHRAGLAHTSPWVQRLAARWVCGGRQMEKRMKWDYWVSQISWLTPTWTVTKTTTLETLCWKHLTIFFSDLWSNKWNIPLLAVIITYYNRVTEQLLGSPGKLLKGRVDRICVEGIPQRSVFALTITNPLNKCLNVCISKFILHFVSYYLFSFP